MTSPGPTAEPKGAGGSPKPRGPRRPGEGPEAEATYRVGWRMAGLGWEFTSHVVAGLLLGWAVDWYWKTQPWGIIGGAVAGLAVGMLQLIRTASKLNSELGPVKRPPGGWRQVDPPSVEEAEAKAGRDHDPQPPTDRPSDGSGPANP